MDRMSLIVVIIADDGCRFWGERVRERNAPLKYGDDGDGHHSEA